MDTEEKNRFLTQRITTTSGLDNKGKWDDLDWIDFIFSDNKINKNVQPRILPAMDQISEI
jgi:hypothetical protein